MSDADQLGQASFLGLLPPACRTSYLAAAQAGSVQRATGSSTRATPATASTSSCPAACASLRSATTATRPRHARAGRRTGELAILTGAQRSASVQALRDTELLEIDGVRFESCSSTATPVSPVGLARALAERIQRGDPVTSTEAPTAVVAVTGVPGIDADGLWRELEPAFSELGDTWCPVGARRGMGRSARAGDACLGELEQSTRLRPPASPSRTGVPGRLLHAPGRSCRARRR